MNSISELHKKYKSKEISITEATQLFLNKSKNLNAKLNSFISIDESNAIEKAQELDKLISDQGFDNILNAHPLLGIPIAHKDIISTKGLLTTAGSNILKNYIPPYNATIVDKLNDSGAIIIGKLNCDAFAHGASGHNSDFGDTKNPYNLDYIPGGSSSGSGVSVGSEQVIVSTGTDTGGSIRNPAAWCNVVGIKPTYGRVSRYGVIAMASSLDSIGHFTRKVEDNAYVLNVTAGFDPKDSTSSHQAVSDYLSGIKEGVKGLRIGLPKEYFTDQVDQEIKAAVMKNVEYLEKEGAIIVEISMPNTEYALAVYYVITPSEVSSNLGRFDGIRFGFERESFGDEAKRRIMIGTYVLSAGYYDAYYLQAQKVRDLVSQDFARAFESVDVMIAPVTPNDPLKIGEELNDPMKMYLLDVLSVTANLAGIPSLSVPAGFSSRNLPIGLQIMGNHFNEKTLYRVGYAIQQNNRLYERTPNL